jgi:hypothetical protein
MVTPEQDKIFYTLRCSQLPSGYKVRCDVENNFFTNGGDGKNMFLDRQDVNCGDKFLRQVQLSRTQRSENHYGYVYECCSIVRS